MLHHPSFTLPVVVFVAVIVCLFVVVVLPYNVLTRLFKLFIEVGKSSHVIRPFTKLKSFQVGVKSQDDLVNATP